MKFGNLSARGYSLMAVCGSKFDPSILPSPPDIPFRHGPDLARAAINAVRRARVISYIERGILPKNALRSPDEHFDDRDEHCIHLILHRSNCLLGTIRCQFHRRIPLEDDPMTLYSEILGRTPRSQISELAILTEIASRCPEATSYLETSGWLVNPDLKKNGVVALSLPIAVWAFGGFFEEFAGIAALRTSNEAAQTLSRLGGNLVKHNNVNILIEDSFYRGSVQLMSLHSRQYNSEISPIVKELSILLSHNGVII